MKYLTIVVAFNLMAHAAPAASVELTVSSFGFDSMGNILMDSPTDGQDVYDSGGSLLGTWQVVSGNTYRANQDQNNRNETSSISYNNLDKINNTNNPDGHTASFASFDASMDLSDFVVIDSEQLDISVSWIYRDIRWQRRDIVVDTGQTNPSYDLEWTINTFDNVNPDLGNLTGNETLTSYGLNQSFGYTGYVDSAPDSTQIVPTTDIVFTGETPDSFLGYTSNGSVAGQLTGKYDGSDFSLTLDTTHSRNVNAIDAWDELTDNGDGDARIGENPRAQLRAFLNADYNYTLEYTTYTFVNVPEPSVSILFSIGLGGMLLRRRRALSS